MAFQPKFNRERFQELMENTPTNFATENGNVNARKEFVKSVLASCGLLWKEFDRNNLYYGGEGSGKSHTVFQHTYIWWWCLKELDMIDYEFGMELIYANLKDLMADMDKYKEIPFRIYTLDESDELNRKNWNKVEVKAFMSKLRKERKNLRIVNLLMPALEEMLPSITLSRIAWIIEVDIDIDNKFNVKRGDFKMMNIPVGKAYYSPFMKKLLSRKAIKNYLNERLYNKDNAFENLPKKYLALRGRTNSTFVFNKEEYKAWARQKNAEDFAEASKENNKHTIQRDTLVKYLLKTGVKQQQLANIIGVSRSLIGEISRNANNINGLNKNTIEV